MNKALLAFAAVFLVCIGLVFWADSSSSKVIEPGPSAAPATAAPTASPAPVGPAATPESTLQKTLLPLSPEDADYFKTLFMPINADHSPNRELQKYRFSQMEVDGRHLLLTADKQDGDYVSGKAESICSFLYGSLTFRLNTMRGAGLFPAVWLLPASGEQYPEVDIYELIGSDPSSWYGVSHYQEHTQHKRSFFKHTFAADAVPDSCVIRFDWTPDAMTWYLDGEKVHSITDHVPQVPMYLLANLAVGGTWAGDPNSTTPFPAILDIEFLEFKPGETYTR